MALAQSIGSRLGGGLGGGIPLIANKLAPQVQGPDYGETESEGRARAALGDADSYQQQMSAQARNYNANLPGIQGGLEDQAADSGRRALAGNLTDVRRGASSRGLLYSGLRQGGEAGAYGNYLSGLSQARAGINEQTQGNASDMLEQAKNQGLNAQAARQSLNDAIYNRRQQGYQQAQGMNEQRTKSLSGLMGGLASVGGAAAGRA